MSDILRNHIRNQLHKLAERLPVMSYCDRHQTFNCRCMDHIEEDQPDLDALAFDAFQASRTYTANLADHTTDESHEGVPGFVYRGGLHIEIAGDMNGYRLQLERDEWSGKGLRELEEKLYRFGVEAGYFVDPDAPKVIAMPTAAPLAVASPRPGVRLGLPTRESLEIAITALDAACAKAEAFSIEWEKMAGAVQTLIGIRDQRGCKAGLGDEWDDDLPSVIDTIVFG